MSKESGFTLIELLGAIVILSIMMAIAVPAVTRILIDQRNSTYVKDAIRLASNMDYQVRSDNKMPVPAKGSCIVMNLTYLDDNTFNDAPNDGEYDRLRSYVVARRKNDRDFGDEEYMYYVTLVEKMKTGSYRGINLTPVDNDGNDIFLYKKDAKDNVVVNLAESDTIDLSDNSFEEITDISGYLWNMGVSCNEVELYAPNMEVSNET